MSSTSGWYIQRYMSSSFPELGVPVSMVMYHVDEMYEDPSQAIEYLKMEARNILPPTPGLAPKVCHSLATPQLSTQSFFDNERVVGFINMDGVWCRLMR